MNKWPIVKLGEIVTPVFRTVPTMPGTVYRQIGVKLWGEGAYERESIDGSQTKYAQLFRTETGDIIVNKIWARNGSVAVVSPALSGCFGSNEFPMFAPKPDRLESRWIHWLTKMQVFWEQCDKKSHGTSGKNRIKPEQFLSVEIPLPLLAEQRRIVARIEELVAQIDEASELRRRLIKDANALSRTGILNFLKQRSDAYPKQSLGDIVTIRGGGTPSKANPFYWSGRIPWITPKDMKSRAITDSIDHISECASQESPAKVLQAGALLVVVRGMILVHTFPSAVLNTTATINQDMKALIPNDKILPEFLCAFFWANNLQIVRLVEKSTHDTRKLKTEKLLNIQVPVPPLSEQRRIVAELDTVQSEINVLKNLQIETAVQLEILFPALLDRAFKGEL